MNVAKRISGDKALIYLDYKNKENKESEVPGSRIAIQYANCYGGSSFFPAGTGGGAPLLGTSTSKTETPLVLHWLLLNKNNILFHSLIIIISSTNKT